MHGFRLRCRRKSERSRNPTPCHPLTSTVKQTVLLYTASPLKAGESVPNQSVLISYISPLKQGFDARRLNPNVLFMKFLELSNASFFIYREPFSGDTDSEARSMARLPACCLPASHAIRRIRYNNTARRSALSTVQYVCLVDGDSPMRSAIQLGLALLAIANLRFLMLIGEVFFFLQSLIPIHRLVLGIRQQAPSHPLSCCIQFNYEPPKPHVLVFVQLRLHVNLDSYTLRFLFFDLTSVWILFLAQAALAQENNTVLKKPLGIRALRVKIRNNQNPYLAVRNYLDQRFGLPKFSKSYDCLLYAVLASFILVVVQALYIIYVMKVTNRLCFTQKTNTGIWRFESINMHVFSALVFSILAIVEWLQKRCTPPAIIWGNSTVFVVNLFISIVRAVALFFGSWYVPLLKLIRAILTISSCSIDPLVRDLKHNAHKTLFCISARWMPREGNYTAQLPRHVRYLCFIIFLAPLITFSAAITRGMVTTGKNFRRIWMIVQPIDAQLMKAATENHDPQDLPDLFLLNLVLPARELPKLEELVDTSYRSVLIIFMAAEIFLLSVYTPFALMCWRDMRTQTDALTDQASTITTDKVSQLNQIIKRLKLTRKILIFRTVVIYLFSSLCIPALYWRFKQPRSAANRTTVSMVEAIAYCGMSVGLNVNLLVITVYCRLILKR
ncbi:hypothetical protein O181_036331 [Austropuccinia psidii MF-1]|uniref:Uncharacterized protein n=1 Tax=Austropuccinia psidii MF-1 TaxID=1389203 RepID=A0A9Q3H9U4_9BASI|nr:hypothetical protein [Austropuccinia psidii MF-1]